MDDMKGMSRRYSQVVTAPGRRVLRYRRDAVGNDLTAALLWCDTHYEPVWVYPDESFTCPYDRVIGFTTEEHDIVFPPWEDY